MKILVTGSAGFIGYHLVTELLALGEEVIGVDNINDYYDVELKYSRLSNHGINRNDIEWKVPTQSKSNSSYTFVRMNLEDKEATAKLFEENNIDYVCNLAAQAGVRYSIINPYAYIESNINGFLNILEGCRHNGVKHLTYASSSSVYGLNESMPFSTSNNVDHPISLYAATKKSNELMAHTYSHLYGLPTTGLRFFTVYGPWGRPDMALFLFTKAILEGKSIKVFNNGEMNRDFTYIDDIVKGILKTIYGIAKPDSNWDARTPNPSSSRAPYKIYNIGNNDPIKLMDFISAIEDKLGVVAEKEFMPMQPGDVKSTYADVTDLVNHFGYKPTTKIAEGIGNFVSWYLKYYKVAS